MNKGAAEGRTDIHRRQLGQPIPDAPAASGRRTPPEPQPSDLDDNPFGIHDHDPDDPDDLYAIGGQFPGSDIGCLLHCHSFTDLVDSLQVWGGDPAHAVRYA